MDLCTLEVLPTTTVKVLDMAFTLAGPDHPVTLEARRTLQADLAKAEEDGHGSEEALERHLATRILSWKNVSDGGVPLDCTFDNALRVIQHPKAKLVIPKPLWAALGDTERFFKV